MIKKKIISYDSGCLFDYGMYVTCSDDKQSIIN